MPHLAPQRINPPAAKYTIPEGTLVSTFPTGMAANPHRTKTELQFESPLSFHGPEIIVFEKDRWTIVVPRSDIIERNDPILHALRFRLRSKTARFLNVWPDQFGKSAGLKPADRTKTILDLAAGDDFLCTMPRLRSRERIEEVFIFRSFPQMPENQPVESGRWFLQTLGSELCSDAP